MPRPNFSAPQHWSGQIAFLTALCCSAKQADSMLVSLKVHLKILSPHSGVQRLNTHAVQRWSGQNAVLTAQSCSAKQADSNVVSLQRHLWIFLQHTGVQCPITNALQHWSGQNAFLAAQSCTFGYFSNTQVFGVPSPMHCSIGQGKMHSSLPRVALQNRLSASLCHCK